MATLNGAIALGLQNETGSLVVGKSADFVALNFNNLELSPVFDVTAHVVYSASREHVSDLWVCGKRLLKQRELTTIDEKDLMTRIKKWNAIMKT